MLGRFKGARRYVALARIHSRQLCANSHLSRTHECGDRYATIAAQVYADRYADR